MINLSGVENNEDLLSRIMTTIHGPLLAGDVLVKTLGYSSSGALRQASLRDMVPVTLFDIPERKFKYALCAEVAEWLIQQRIANCAQPFEFTVGLVESKSAQLKLFILEYGYLLHEADLVKLLCVENQDQLIQKQRLGEQPFGIFKIDHRQNKRFALTIEAVHYFL